MSEFSNEDTLTKFFKALSDAQRLKMVGLLALEPKSIVELSENLNLKSPTVQKHVSHLEDIDLVKKQGNRYQLDTGALERMAKEVLSGLRPQVRPEDFEGGAYERKVLSDFVQPDGRLKDIPAQEKKLLVVLGHIAQSFEPGERYPEREVNEMLLRYHRDSALLRRYLVDYGFLGREGGGGEYWRVEGAVNI